MQEDHSIYEEEEVLRFPPILVGVSGGSASGKTTLCNEIRKEIEGEGCVIVSLDSFYKGLEGKSPKDYNFDHPNALDFDLAYDCVMNLLERKKTQIPIYNFVTHSREKNSIELESADIVLFEGILAMYDERLRDRMNLKIFVHCDDDIRLARRVLRDIEERGRELEGVLFQYNRFVRKSFEEFVKPTMKFADIIVPGNRPNVVSMKFIVQNLKNQLQNISRLKNYFKTNLIYHGDMLNSILAPQRKTKTSYEINKNPYSEESNIYTKKQLVFENDEYHKGGYKREFRMIHETFKIKDFRRLLKSYTKSALRLLEELLKKLNIDIKDVTLHIQEIPESYSEYEKDDAPKLSKEELSKVLKEDAARFTRQVSASIEKDLKEIHETKHIALLVPIIYRTNFRYYKIYIEKLVSENPEACIFILNVFSQHSRLTELAQISEKIKIINILVLSNLKKFKTILKENVRDSKGNKIAKGSEDILHESHFFSKCSKACFKFFRKRVGSPLKEEKKGE